MMCYPFIVNNVLFVRFEAKKRSKKQKSLSLHHISTQKEMQDKPVSLTFDRFKALVEAYKSNTPSNIVITKDFSVVTDLRYVLQAVLQVGSIFQLQDYRCGLIRSGKATVRFNLLDKELTSGTLVFLTPGTIVQPLKASKDFNLTGMACSPDFLHLALNNDFPATFNRSMTDAQKLLSSTESSFIQRLFGLLHETVSQPEHSQQVVKSIIRTIIYQYDFHFSVVKETTTEYSNNRNIFERFIYLVNNHCKQEHQMAFYAEKMCLTDRYLGTVVKAVSGQTGKEWIDRALITSAKVMLKHSDRTVVQIADELNFPTVSFFCKYFKRLTNLTPNQFRQTVP